MGKSRNLRNLTSVAWSCKGFLNFQRLYHLVSLLIHFFPNFLLVSPWNHQKGTLGRNGLTKNQKLFSWRLTSIFLLKCSMFFLSVKINNCPFINWNALYKILIFIEVAHVLGLFFYWMVKESELIYVWPASKHFRVIF